MTTCLQKQEAIKNGEKKYFTGKPCKHGHIAERYTKDGNCIVCRASQYSRDFDKVSKRQKVRRSKPEVKEKNKKTGQIYSQKNKTKLSKGKAKWVDNNRERHNNNYNAWQKKKYRTDENFKMMKILRSRLTSALKGNIKAGPTMKLIGCTIEELWLHIESLFEPGMTKENNGNGDGFWHLDHKMPCFSFDLSKLEQQKKCFHYKNLQPLWSNDNLKKAAKIL